ncbi:hypothetical protein TNCV_1718311 [Trichonephila clavipes]|nr:hypothetical protein TNCV_1718311 [Trichonephila clavipes]
MQENLRFCSHASLPRSTNQSGHSLPGRPTHIRPHTLSRYGMEERFAFRFPVTPSIMEALFPSHTDWLFDDRVHERRESRYDSGARGHRLQRSSHSEVVRRKASCQADSCSYHVCSPTPAIMWDRFIPEEEVGGLWETGFYEIRRPISEVFESLNVVIGN